MEGSKFQEDLLVLDLPHQRGTAVTKYRKGASALIMAAGCRIVVIVLAKWSSATAAVGKPFTICRCRL